MVDPEDARARAKGRTKQAQRREDEEEDPAKTWGPRNPRAMSGNPQNPGPDPQDPERGLQRGDSDQA